MGSLEKDIQQSRFASEQLKANLNVIYTANRLNNRISAYLKAYNLTHEQFNVLRILRGKHPDSMCQKDIQARMLAASSNLTLIIKKLLSKKLISLKQAAHDRREYVINIKKTGLDILKQIDKRFNENEFLINNLTDKESLLLNRLLDKLRSE